MPARGRAPGYAMQVLVANADDFGFTKGVNDGIVRCCRTGLLRSTTLMANGDAFDDAVRQARETPELDVGVHCVLISGAMLSRPGEALPSTYAGFLRRIAAGWRESEIEAEVRAQIERICEAGIRPSHIDTHKHTHLLKRVRNVVLRLAEEYGIGWVRSPFDIPLIAGGGRTTPRLRLFQKAVQPRAERFRREIARAGLRTTEHFAGFSMTGQLRTEGLLELLRQLPDGATELMTHPGIHDAELEGARTRLKKSRQEEMEALTDPRVVEAAERLGIAVRSFADLD